MIGRHITAGMHWRHRLGIRFATIFVMTTTSPGISPSMAMPPHPDVAERIRLGELQAPRTLLDVNDPWDRAFGRPHGTPRVRATAVDTFNTLAILIDYADQSAAVNAEDFDTLLYVVGTNSVRDFYLENSYGNFDMVTVHLPSATGWQNAPQTTDYYANGEHGLGSSSYPNNAKKLVEEAVAAADPLVDFSQYDNDNDGRLDALMIIHSGPGAEFTGDVNDIWSHKWGISPQNRDGVLISSYAIMPEYWSSPGDITIGVFAHELGHVFGLPDLYDTDYSSRGVGRWSVMAGGAWNGSLGNSPAHFDAWCKIQLGFLTPVIPAGQMTSAPFPQLATDSVVYRLWDGGSGSDEYFLVENRQRSGFDAGLPNEGLLIWHIDDGVSNNNDEWYPGHTGSGHFLVALEQSDGDWDLEQRINNGDSGDPFPGSGNKRSFNSTTTPNSLAYDGGVSFVTLSNISDSDSLMTADLTVSLASAVDEDGILPESPLSVRNYPNPFNAGTRIEAEVQQPGPIELVIYNLLGGEVRRIGSSFAAPGTWSVNWDGRDARGSELASGVYWYRVTSGDALDHGKMLMIK